MLEETEETYLFNSAQTMLDGMAGQLTAAFVQAGNGVLKDSLLDADYFLAVARSLLAGTNGPPVPSLLGQGARVAATLADIQAEQLKEVPDFLGFCRVVDFSQFKVRGHYTHTERLGRYFQCLMWLGRIDFPVAGGHSSVVLTTFGSRLPANWAWRSSFGICSTFRASLTLGPTWSGP
jgi:hypothetical protein